LYGKAFVALTEFSASVPPIRLPLMASAPPFTVQVWPAAMVREPVCVRLAEAPLCCTVKPLLS
jgi:hypothetical protein